MFDRYVILLAVALTGFCTLAAQVIYPRTLHPYFGSGSNIGSAVVAMSLAGLATGYFIGGFDGGGPLRRMTAGLAVGGVWFIFVANLWSNLDNIAGDAGTVRLLLTAALLTVVPGVALGAISPLAVRALRQRSEDRPSERPAIVFGVGTVANVIGGLASGYWLVPFVGLTTSLTIMGALLLAAAIGVLAASRRMAESGIASDVEEELADEVTAGPGSASESAERPPLLSSHGGLIALAAYSGVASLAIEVSGTRMLASNFGPTTTLWASVLSVSLGGLAIGYFIGGRFPQDLMRSALGIVIGMNSLWLLASAWLLSALGQSSPTNSLGLLLTITTTAFLPTFVMFGVESQLIVGIVAGESKGEAVASVTGRVFAASTVGGLIGALSGVFFLLPVLGLSLFVRLAAACYLAMAAVTTDRARRMLLGLAAVAAIFPLPNWVWRDEPGVLLAQTEGRHQTIRVYSDERAYLRFHLGPTYESEVDLQTRLPRFGYARTILGYAGDVEQQRVLVIGGAGHALARAFETKGAEVTEVEVDPRVAAISDEYFGPIGGDVVIDDGRRFLAESEPGSYDVVVVDAFDGPRVVPPHLTTVEFYEAVRCALSDDGTMYINMIGRASGQGSDSFLAMSSTVASVFPAAGRDGGAGNIVLIASNGQVPSSLPPLEVLVAPSTDDLNPMEIMTNRSS